MTRIRANRESIDDRFSVLGFTVNADQPLYEVGLATDPELFKPEHRARRTADNFYASPLQGTRPRSDAVYLVPPSVVARFVGQPRLYFGVATYADSDRSKPVSVRRPDGGHMYVSLRGLTERGLRRGVRNGQAGNGASYGTPVPTPAWGGDAVVDTVAAAPPQNGDGAGAGAATSPAPYSDGYSDDLWRQSPAAAAEPGAAPATAAHNPAVPAPGTAAPATAQAFRHNGNGQADAGYRQASFRAAQQRDDYDDGFGPMPAARSALRPAPPIAPTARALRVVSSYYNPSDWLDALRTQIGFFAASAQWWAGVENTTVMPHSAICQARTVDGSTEGGQHGSAFFIAPNLLLTAAHVVDGQSELIVVPGKNGAGTSSANEPFGRFRVSAADMVKHPSYVASSRDFDMALIRVPAAHASPNYFELVEELTQSRPEGVVVSGYAAYSDPQGIIDSIVNATIDADKQHMHGGYIRSLPTDETFDYDLQSLGGTSGSPVYYIENGDAPRTYMVGVHVAGHSDTTNLGCRITPAKLAWIRQQAAAWRQSLTFSLGARALSDEAATTDDAGFADAERYTHVPEPVEAEFAEAQALRTRAFTASTPDYPGASRFVPAHARNFRAGRRQGAVIDRIVIHITAGGPRIDGTIRWFQDGERRNATTGEQAGPSSAHYIVGRDGEVVQMVRNADTAYHASSANSRSIGIEHNANKPYRLNRRDLPPTMEQYQASAHLVAWLAAQYGIPLDRTHIVGHIEATPADNHDCPSSYWDWETYMQCVQLAAQALAQNSSTGEVPASSQGLRNRAPVRAQEIITPFYDPSNPSTALTCQNDAFSLAREEWFVGVDDTRSFPHSAICLLEMKDAAGNVTGRGTGFYIGANRILTCAHNLHGEHSVDIVPGNNGRGNEPFGRCNVSFDSWRIAPDYPSGGYDRDLAVIENVPIAAPGNAWFSFLNATPSDQMPLVVCGYSSRSEAVPSLTAAIDGFKQHLHGGYARKMETQDTIDYPILTLKRASGSPVYTLRDDGNGLQALICAVHVSGVRADTQGLNTGCFITPGKIDWIEGRTTSFAYRAPTPAARSTSAAMAPRALVRAQELITPYYDPSNPGTALQCTNDAFSQQREEWYVGVEDTSAFPHSAICYLRMTAPDGKASTGTGFYIGRNRILTCAHNLHGKSTVQIVPGRNGAGTAPFGQATIDSTQWRIAPRYTGNGDWDNDLAVIDNAPIAAPNGAFFRFMQATPGGAMPLAVCGYSSGSKLHRELGPVADRNKQHLHGGHAQGQATFDTIDYDILAVAGASGSPVYTVRDEGNGLEAFVCGVHVTRGPIDPGTGGTSVNRGCFITPAKIDWIEGRATTFNYRGPRALSSEGVEHRVALVPQPDKNACWAASMAMLKSFRSDASFDPEAFVREAGGSLATSYGWDQLERVRDHYGFRVIEQPSNASLYHTPVQWAQWLGDLGPLWVVIVGAPHAVVISGIRGDLSDAASTEVYVLNPWDTTTVFDNDAVAFNPPNRGHEGWMPFEEFAADFGNMAQPDYGNWRVLHLPATTAQAQSLSAQGRYRLAPPPAPLGRALSDGVPEPIEPTRVPGTRMSVVRGSAGASRWALDQLEGYKPPQAMVPSVSSLQPTDVVIDLGEWPALEGQAAPLPLSVRFRSQADGSVGDVAIIAGTPTQPGYGVEVVARIDDAPDADGVAALTVGIDVRFSGLAQGAPSARIELRLLGNGRYERSNRWTDTSLAA
ncbi:trypsin-like peptidase domain-containing protein [Pseudoxanthomonas wuyuanensis]|uniref:Serine protease n=1 Tax=Pseudoxanthomonas wuyuanensis TaxID=1073196 RepID=A0A286CYV8_9GAMM|nr:trypsin-like peptidase domain-containing protein [Pseudoxanthomonas wuyuanensis]KAF1722806.1 hypothetical protein CSC75_03045 [Pseudoxanthomonas wuyuanensis]SOD51581.1 Trypsin-like peptidase domain-containing protein [Pseudoxanthomonas wuyuanensis]